MKKILSLVMALAMVLGCFAMAETTSILDADMDELLVLDRESSLNDWEGEWVLVAAYITADFAEEYDVEQSGLLAVPENAATLTITALKDATANDKVLHPRPHLRPVRRADFLRRGQLHGQERVGRMGEQRHREGGL